MCATCLARREKNIMRVFDCKTESCQLLFKKAPYIVDFLCETCAREWQLLKDNLEHLSVSFSYVPTLVRGLDYYGKTVFEFVSTRLGAQNAFCGGGRYDTLAKELGGSEDEPSIGAAIGIERLLLLLAEKKDLALPHRPKLHVIVPLSEAQQSLALLLADELQAHNLCVDILLEGDSVKSMMRKANKMGAAYVILLGEEEQQRRMATVKNMITGEEEKVLQTQLAEKLKI
jgi:histidyl-tRNA synthetase